MEVHNVPTVHVGYLYLQFDQIVALAEATLGTCKCTLCTCMASVCMLGEAFALGVISCDRVAYLTNEICSSLEDHTGSKL